jgi:hypothetical protein
MTRALDALTRADRPQADYSLLAGPAVATFASHTARALTGVPGGEDVQRVAGGGAGLGGENHEALPGSVGAVPGRTGETSLAHSLARAQAVREPAFQEAHGPTPPIRSIAYRTMKPGPWGLGNSASGDM